MSAINMTDADLAEIEARADAATPGPWRVDDKRPPECNIRHEGPGWPICGMWSLSDNRPENATFIAHARSDVKDLVAEVRRLQGAIETLRARLCGNVCHGDDCACFYQGDNWNPCPLATDEDIAAFLSAAPEGDES